MGTSTSASRQASIRSTTTTATTVTVKMTPDHKPPDYRRMDSRSYRYFRRIQPLLFFVALLVILLGYAFFGAAVFVYLESENEKESYQMLMRERATFLGMVNASIEAAARAGNASLQPTTVIANIDPDPNANATAFGGATAAPVVVNFTMIDEELRKFELMVKKFRNLDPDGKPMWNYFGALFFSATVISTIGK